MFIVLYESMFNERIDNIERNPVKPIQHIQNMDRLLEHLNKNILSDSSDLTKHVNSTKLYYDRDVYSIQALVKLFQQISDLLKENEYEFSDSEYQSTSSSSSGNSGNSYSSRISSSTSSVSSKGGSSSVYSIPSTKESSSDFTLPSESDGVYSTEHVHNDNRSVSEKSSIDSRRSSGTASEVNNSRVSKRSLFSSDSSIHESEDTPRYSPIHSENDSISKQSENTSENTSPATSPRAETNSQNLLETIKKEYEEEEEKASVPKQILMEAFEKAIQKRQSTSRGNGSRNDTFDTYISDEELDKSGINIPVSSIDKLSSPGRSQSSASTIIQIAHDRLSKEFEKSNEKYENDVDHIQSSEDSDEELAQKELTKSAKKKRKLVDHKPQKSNVLLQPSPTSIVEKYHKRKTRDISPIKKSDVDPDLLKYEKVYYNYLKSFVENVLDDELQYNHEQFAHVANHDTNRKIDEIKFRRFKEEQERLVLSCMIDRRLKEEQFLKEIFSKIMRVEKESLRYEQLRLKEEGNTLERRNKLKLENVENLYVILLILLIIK
jgi:hypothetical protein